MRNHAKALALGAILLVGAMPASAATLTLTDTFGGTNTIWTLTVETGCVTCSVSLSAFFEDPAGPAVNAYTDKYLDSVQWVIDNPDADPTSHGFNATNAGVPANWSFTLDENLSASGCGGGAADAVCGEWIGGGVGSGYKIVNGSTLTWDFDTTFASALPGTLVSGNIRAAFNKVWYGKVKNYNIFSPDGGTFVTSSTTTTGSAAPEPALLTLLGVGLALGSRRLRRT
jgi:hypothetical protein